MYTMSRVCRVGTLNARASWESVTSPETECIASLNKIRVLASRKKGMVTASVKQVSAIHGQCISAAYLGGILMIWPPKQNSASI